MTFAIERLLESREMRIPVRVVRYTTGSEPKFGVLTPGGTRIEGLKGDPLFQEVEPSGEIVTLDDVRLLSPVIPRSKVIGAANNYYPSEGSDSFEAPATPQVFLKPNTSVVGPGDGIALPSWSEDVWGEPELAVVIRTLCKDIPAQQARDVIFGYTIVNDLTARDAQVGDMQWTRAKSFDSSCPIGPWIEVDHEFDFDMLDVTARVDGETRVVGNTRDMIYSIPELIAYVSSVMTLLPGDIIATGTPGACGPLQPGQRMECEVEGIGVLDNVVIRRD